MELGEQCVHRDVVWQPRCRQRLTPCMFIRRQLPGSAPGALLTASHSRGIGTPRKQPAATRT